MIFLSGSQVTGRSRYDALVCTNSDRIIGEAGSSIKADWSDLINVEMHGTHVYTSYIFKGVLRNGQKKKCLSFRMS